MPGKEEICGHHPHRKRNLKHRFEVIRTLGQGTYGKVKLAIERETGESFAIKSIRKRNIGNEQDLGRLRREIEVMASLSHPHIIAIYEVLENHDKIIIVMEYASGGELYDYCNEKRGLYDHEAKKFFRQVVSAVHYLHQNGIVHRDLKLENIVLDQNGNAKIADFGFANIYNKDSLLKTFCGSPLYASPEIVNGLPYMGPEVDCWSLGVLLYAMVYGAMPFDGSDFRRLRNQITAGDYFTPNRPSDAGGVISCLLHPNPAKRATVDQVQQHWWLSHGHEESAALDASLGKPVDQENLVRKLSQASDTSSSLDGDLGDMYNHGNIDDGSSSQNNKSNSSQSIKGILKKPKQYDTGVKPTSKSPSQNESCQRSRSLDIDLSLSERSSLPVMIQSKPQNTAELCSSAPSTAVFDSTRRPKKSILKKRRPQPYTGADSGCFMDESLDLLSPVTRTNDLSPATNMNPALEIIGRSLETRDPLLEKSGLSKHSDDSEKPVTGHSSSEESHENTSNSLQTDCMLHSQGIVPTNETNSDPTGEPCNSSSEACYDLLDIEAVLDDILDDSPTASTDNVGQSESQNNGDSGFGDESCPESPEVATETESHSNAVMKADLHDIPGVVTSTPTPQSSRRKTRKSILKKQKSPDPTWRYSAESQGSTSSGDLLDFSYDSAEGLSDMFLPLSLPRPTEDCVKLEMSIISGDLMAEILPPDTDDEELGPPPPLPTQPPPPFVCHNNDLWSSHCQDLHNDNDDVVHKVLKLGDEDLNRNSALPAESSSLDWDEVEDIYRKALELRQQWG